MKRFSAILLVLSLIICNFPAYTAAGDEGHMLPEDPIVGKEYYTAADYMINKSLFVPKWYDGNNPAELWADADGRWSDINARAHAESGFDTSILAIGHRGDRWEKYYPENSAEGFLSVILYGVDVIEVDVRKTRDDVIIVMHDETLTGTTNVEQYRQAHPGEVPESDNVCDWTYEELLKLRLKFRSGAVAAHNDNNGAVTDYIIPTLADILFLAKGRVYVTLDKVGSGSDPVSWADCYSVISSVPGSCAHVFYPWNLADPLTGMSNISKAADTCMFGISSTYGGAANTPDTVKDMAMTLRDAGIAAVGRPNMDYSLDCWKTILSDIAGTMHIEGEKLGGGTTGLEDDIEAYAYWQSMVDQGYTFLMTENVYKLIDFVKANNFSEPDPAEGPYQIQLTDMEHHAVGTVIGASNANNRDTITSTVSSSGGILGSQAWKLHITDIGYNYDQTNWMVISDASKLFTKTHKFVADDILWFWVNNTSAYDKAFMLAFDAENANALFCGNNIYTIVPDSGAPAVEAVSVGNTSSNGIGLAKHGTTSVRRFVLGGGCAGWLGIPVSEIAKDQSGTNKGWLIGAKLNSFEFYLRNPWGNASISDKGAVSDIYLDEIWVTSSDEVMPALSDAALLYKQVESSDTVIDFEAGWKDDAYLTVSGTPVSACPWGFKINSGGVALETISFVDAQSEGLIGEGIDGTVLKWTIDDTWVGATEGNLFGRKKAAGGVAFLNTSRQSGIKNNWSDSDSMVIYVDGSKAESSFEVELRLIERDTTSTGQQWLYNAGGSISVSQYYYQDENGVFKPASMFQGRAVLPAGYKGQLKVAFSELTVYDEGNNYHGTDETLNLTDVMYYGLGIRGMKGDVIYVDNMALSGCVKDEGTFRFSTLYGNDMIFQQGKSFNVGGFGPDGKDVTVSLIKDTAVLQQKAAVSDGKWQVTFDGVSGSYDEYTITAVCDGVTASLTGVVFGEVWATGGQSNMQIRVNETEGIIGLFESDWKNDNIRIYRQQAESSLTSGGKYTEPHGLWCTGSDWDAVYTTSSVGYYFARRMQEALDVPFGIINTAVGGSGLSVWTDTDVAKEYPDFYNRMNELDYLDTESGNLNYLGAFFDTRVAPFEGYKAAGMIWYQGCHDKSHPEVQSMGYEPLVMSWTKVFGDGTDTPLPLVSIQIAAYASAGSDGTLTANYMLNKAKREGAAAVEAAGGKAIEVPLYDFKVVVDNIHPTNKREVAERASLAALGKVYGKREIYSGPVIKSVIQEGSKLTLTFDNVGNGLRFKQIPEGYRIVDTADNAVVIPDDCYANVLNGFSVSDGLMTYNLTGTITGTDTVELTLPNTNTMLDLYYAYASRSLAANLYNETSDYDFAALPFHYQIKTGSPLPHSIRLWDVDSAEAGAAVGSVSNNTARTQVSSTVSETGGLIGAGNQSSQAWAYSLYNVVKTGTNSQAETVIFNIPGNPFGFKTGYSLPADDMIWFFVNTKLTGPQTLFLYINGSAIGNTLVTDKIYTIKDNNGVPEIETIVKGSASANGIGLENHGSSGWQRITLTKDACGWVGMPVSAFADAAGREFTSINAIVRSYKPTEQSEGDAVYLDEFWLTSPGLMPDLPAVMLLNKTSICISGMNVDVGASYSVNFFAENASDDMKMRFTLAGKSVVVSDYTVSDGLCGDAHCFTLDKVSSLDFCEEITAELLDGDDQVLDSRSISVAGYLNMLYELNPGDSKLLALIADMAVFADKSITYIGSGTGKPMEECSWASELSTCAGKPSGSRVFVDFSEDHKNYIRGAGLAFDSYMRIYFIVKWDGESNIRIMLNKDLNGISVPLIDSTISDLISEGLAISLGNGFYRIFTDNVSASDFGRTFTLNLGENYSMINHLEYNGYAYLEVNWDNPNESLKALCRSIAAYAGAAEEYKY